VRPRFAALGPQRYSIAKNGWLTVNDTPAPVQSHGIPRQIDHHWARALAFTLTLAALVAAAMGADWALAISAIVLCGVGFGFFYLLFPGGLPFGITVANALAVYVCMFEFYRDANFREAAEPFALAALGAPVVAFLFACIVRRRPIAAAIRARRTHEIRHLPRLSRWVPTVAVVGAVSFVLPRFQLDAEQQGLGLLAAMTLISIAVAYAVRDVVLLLIDVAVVFESVTHRLRRLVMPMMAFLTYYSLLVVVFACLYRLADLSTGSNQFSVHGTRGAISFADALYFSVVTIATVGYGDITPDAPLVRGLAAIEVVLGILLLLFGFSEIMRVGTGEPPRRPRLPPDQS
jgi:voltage-gated potassium channel